MQNDFGQENIKETFNKFHKAVHENPLGIFICDNQSIIEYVNPKFTEISGYNEEELIGTKPGIWKSEQTNPEIYRRMWKTITRGNVWKGELLNKRKSGELFWISSYITPVKNESLEITNYISVAEDITEHKKTEQKMISLSMYPLVNPNIVIKISRKGDILYANPFTAGFLKENEISNIFEILPKNTLEIVDESISTGKFKKDIEVMVADHFFVYEFTPFRTEEVVYIYGKDITELKEKESALAYASKAKSDFLANMSHELRTPLNSIIGFSEVLYDETFGSLNEKQKEYLDDVLSSGQHLLSLINDILDLSKIEAGKMGLSKEKFPLDLLVENSFVLIKEKALRHNIGLISDIPADIGEIEADLRRIKQVLYNLLSNAAKFTGDGGKIGVKAERSDSFVKITVWDTGIGISQADQQKIFQDFIQVENPYTKKNTGTGLGLSLTRKIVEMHGGRIWVESEGERKGTAFIFTIPVAH